MRHFNLPNLAVAFGGEGPEAAIIVAPPAAERME
jgi:hypothetical protein